jgi:predicted aspartyl protease
VPIIHRAVFHPIIGPDGKPLVLPPPTGLHLAGPRVQVSVGLAQSFAEALLLRGEVIPDAVVGDALVDTGASHTCIDDAVAKNMGLPVVGRIKVGSASHHSTEQNQYPIRIEFLGAGITSNVLQAPAAALAAQGLTMLIGRDILQEFLLVYNGPIGQWTMVLA